MNSTTIESWEKDKVASLKRRGKIRQVSSLLSLFFSHPSVVVQNGVVLIFETGVQQYRYPYHLGYIRNLKDVLGPNPFTWWIPQRVPGDGLSYKVGKGLGEWKDRDSVWKRFGRSCRGWWSGGKKGWNEREKEKVSDDEGQGDSGETE